MDSCLGPEAYAATAPYYSLVDFSDRWSLAIAGLFITARQEGLEYAIDSHLSGSTGLGNLALNQLIDADFLQPSFNWSSGLFLEGSWIGEDGWEGSLGWTRVHQTSSSYNEASDNHSLLPLWSAYQFPLSSAPVLFADRIHSSWQLKCDLADLSLSRRYWTGRRMTLRPLIGLRAAEMRQTLRLQQDGGSWAATDLTPAYHNEIELESQFRAVGPRIGFDAACLLGGGWSLFGCLSGGILYGRFCLHQEEANRAVLFPFSKTAICETKQRLRLASGFSEAELGLQWAGSFNEGRNLLSLGLSWQQQLFWNQNQWKRIRRVGSSGSSSPNDSGQNLLFRTTGDLSLQGWTLQLTTHF